MDWQQESELLDYAREWADEEEKRATAFGLAPGEIDGEPVESIRWLIAEREKALRIIEAWHQLANHLERIIEAAPSMRAVDVYAALAVDRDRITAARDA